eukprot:1621692-Rhodomonas_salina.2
MTATLLQMDTKLAESQSQLAAAMAAMSGLNAVLGGTGGVGLDGSGGRVDPKEAIAQITSTARGLEEE